MPDSLLRLSAHIASALVDPRRRSIVLGDLRALRQELAAGGRRQLGHRADAAILILEFVDHSPEFVNLHAFQVVAWLVASIQEGCRQVESGAIHSGQTRSSAGKRRRPAPPSFAPGDEAAAHGDLRLVSDILLGEILHEQQILTRDQLGQALRQQLKTRRPLGRCIVTLGLASEWQVHKAILLQDRLREGKAASSAKARRGKLDHDQAARQRRFIESLNSCLLGQILIRLGTITSEQLDRALQLQRSTGVRIGEALVEIGAVNWNQIRTAIRVQGGLRHDA